MAKKISKQLTFKNLVAPCVCALLLSLAFSWGNLGFLAWACLVPLFLEMNNKTRKQRWLLLFVFSVLFFLGTLYWIVHVSLVGLLCLCLFLGFEFSILGIIIPAPNDKHSIWITPLLWVIFERLRGFLFSGFGWGLIGYTQFENLPLIQSADIFGVWGVSFLIVLVNLCVTRFILHKTRFSWKKSFVIVPALLLISIYGYGYYKLSAKFPAPEIKISLIQGNIPQEHKWDPDYAVSILKQFSDLSLLAASEKPDLIIWPETSVPGYLLDEPPLYLAITELSKQTKTHLLVGSPREDYEKKAYFNSIFLFGPNGHLKRLHDKIHLVPFGEYIPYKHLFPFLNNTQIADFSAGSKHSIFAVPNVQGDLIRFGVLICFEDTFPGLVKQFRKKGADFLVTVTNEAWFKNSTEPLQHTAISVFRAIENRCWFLRCANTGITCFIDPRGRIQRKVEINEKDLFVPGITTMHLNN